LAPGGQEPARRMEGHAMYQLRMTGQDSGFLAGHRVPEPNGGVPAGRSEPAVIRRLRELGNRIRVTAARQNVFAESTILAPVRPMPATRGELPAIGSIDDAVHHIPVAGESPNFPSRPRLPELDLPLLASCRQLLPIGTEGNGQHSTRVGIQGPDFLPGHGAPE